MAPQKGRVNQNLKKKYCSYHLKRTLQVGKLLHHYNYGRPIVFQAALLIQLFSYFNKPIKKKERHAPKKDNSNFRHELYIRRKKRRGRKFSNHIETGCTLLYSQRQ